MLLLLSLRRAEFNDLLRSKGRPPLDNLDGALQLSLLLAFERAKGETSFWHPYISALPPRAPNAWQMGDAELRSALAQYGELDCWGSCLMPTAGM